MGAAWPEKKLITRPTQSTKNWLFVVGNVLIMLYVVMIYLEGGSIFFLLLQLLVATANVLMMLSVDEHKSRKIIAVAGLFLFIWSLTIMENYHTILFIIGLLCIAFGYASKTGSLHRNLPLTLGSICIAIFSYVEASWIFFGLNALFAVFSGYYTVKNMRTAFSVTL